MCPPEGYHFRAFLVWNRGYRFCPFSLTGCIFRCVSNNVFSSNLLPRTLHREEKTETFGRFQLPDIHRAGGFPCNAVRGGDDPLRSDQSSATVREAGRRPEHRLPRPVTVPSSRASYDPGVRPDATWTCNTQSEWSMFDRWADGKATVPREKSHAKTL